MITSIYVIESEVNGPVGAYTNKKYILEKLDKYLFNNYVFEIEDYKMLKDCINEGSFMWESIELFSELDDDKPVDKVDTLHIRTFSDFDDII